MYEDIYFPGTTKPVRLTTERAQKIYSEDGHYTSLAISSGRFTGERTSFDNKGQMTARIRKSPLDANQFVHEKFDGKGHTDKRYYSRLDPKTGLRTSLGCNPDFDEHFIIKHSLADGAYENETQLYPSGKVKNVRQYQGNLVKTMSSFHDDETNSLNQVVEFENNIGIKATRFDENHKIKSVSKRNTTLESYVCITVIKDLMDTEITEVVENGKLVQTTSQEGSRIHKTVVTEWDEQDQPVKGHRTFHWGRELVRESEVTANKGSFIDTGIGLQAKFLTLDSIITYRDNTGELLGQIAYPGIEEIDGHLVPVPNSLATPSPV